MAEISNISEAKAHLSKLVELARSGREVVLTRGGRPVAKIVRYEGPTVRRLDGSWKGRVEMAEDFDELSPEIEALFALDAK